MSLYRRMRFTRTSQGSTAVSTGAGTGPADIFASGWETSTGTTDAALNDGSTNWTAWGGSLGEVVSTVSHDGANSVQLSHPASSAYLPNGPAWRVGKDLVTGSTEERWFRVWVRHSTNWTWGNNEHKVFILAKTGNIQTVYCNVNAGGVRGDPGHIRVVNQEGSVNLDSTGIIKTDGTWQKIELAVKPGTGTAGQIKCWLDNVALTFSGGDPLAQNVGADIWSWKVDGTYNDYQNVVNGGVTITRWVDNFAVGSTGRIAD